MKKLIKRVLGLYKKFLALTVLGHSMVASSRSTKEKVVSANAVQLSENGLTITLSRKQVMLWLTKLAPSVKIKEGSKHKPMLCLLPLQINMIEDEKVLYAPVVSINLENWREELMEGVTTSDTTSILVSWDTSLEVNQDIINSSIVKSKSSFVKKDDEGKEVPYTLNDLIPESSRSSLKSMIASLASNFKIKGNQEGMVLKLSEGKIAGMFFEFTDQFQMRRELDSIMEAPSTLVQTYLSKSEDDKLVLNADYPIGHHAKSYQMASGQFDMSRAIWAMLKETTSNLIVTVLGGPGTGKSSALKNVFHSIQVDTAIKLMSNENAQLKPVLFTATANKAISGVVSGMQNVYDAGSKKTVELSKPEVLAMIEKLSTEEYNEEFKAKIKSKFHSLNMVIVNRTAMYESISTHGIHADFKNLENSLIEQSRILGQQREYSKLEKEEANKALFAILQISGEEKTSSAADVKFAVDFINTNKDNIQFVASKIHAQGMMSKFFDRQVLELETGEVIKDSAEIELLNHIVSTIDVETFTSVLDSKDQLAKKERIDDLIVKLLKSKNFKGDKIENFEKQIKIMMSSKTLVEYQRKGLYNISNKLSMIAESFNWQIALSKKEDVLKALNVLVANNRYEALIGSYGYTEKEHEAFLSALALVYPFVTSTLASVTSMFPGINRNVKPYSIVIADEAGMISVQDMLPALQRAEKALLVGDTQQLQPINPILEVFLKRLRTNTNNEDFWKKFSPSEVSAFHRASGLNEGGFGSFGSAIILDEHRRCLKGIFDLVIGNIVQYPGLTCETKLGKYDRETYDKLGGKESFFFDVQNSDKKSFVKINLDEINKIEKILDRLEKAGFDLTTDVGIITPYKAQSNKLTEKFAERLGQVEGAEPRIGTVHKFQGAEYKVVIFSSVVSREDDSLNFINNGPYMVNVAVTRAKNHFIMVGDFNKLTSLKSEMNYIGNVASKIETSDTGLLVR